MSHTMEIKEYVHDQLDNEVNAIGGWYIMTKEAQLPFQDKRVFYLTGHAQFDSTCCGVGGCSYAVVQGFIVKWKTKKNEHGIDVSQIVPISDPVLQKEIKTLIMRDEVISQVVFIPSL